MGDGPDEIHSSPPDESGVSRMKTAPSRDREGRIYPVFEDPAGDGSDRKTDGEHVIPRFERLGDRDPAESVGDGREADVDSDTSESKTSVGWPAWSLDDSRFSVRDWRIVPDFEERSMAAIVSPHRAPEVVVPSFDRPRRHPAEPSPRAGIPTEVLPSFDAPSDQSSIGALLAGAAERGVPTTREEVTPSERQESTTYEDDGFGIEGPEYDQEMPLAQHIEEMIKRLAVVIVVAGSVSLVTFPFADQIINFLWYSILPEGDLAQPRIYGPLEFLLTQIKVASLMGLIVALPILVYETYAFMRPGLYPRERKYYLAAIPTSLVLALVGVAFAFFIILPALFTYFMFYSQDAGEIAFGLGQTVGLMLILKAYLAIVFQIPLLIMLAIMMGLTTRRWLAEKRLYFWGAFLGIAFISSPDPTGMAPIVIALTMVGLFEGTLAVLKWVGR